MAVGRRVPAAILALVLTLFPAALERYRTACVAGTATPRSATSAPSAHACHDAAPSGDATTGARLDPLPRACGHGDEARARDSVSLLAGKSQTGVSVPAIAPVPQNLQVEISSLYVTRPPGRGLFPPGLPSLNSPLRL